jgi:hypothetical protein
MKKDATMRESQQTKTAGFNSRTSENRTLVERLRK